MDNIMDFEVIEAKICDLVKRSLINRQLKEELTFSLNEKTIDIAWKLYFINLRKYSFRIHSDEIRHIQNQHQDEVYHICKIHYYLDKFKKIEKTSTRDTETGKTIPCLTFTTQLKDKRVKIVKLNISREKILSLKTLCEET